MHTISGEAKAIFQMLAGVPFANNTGPARIIQEFDVSYDNRCADWKLLEALVNALNASPPCDAPKHLYAALGQVLQGDLIASSSSPIASMQPKAAEPAASKGKHTRKRRKASDGSAAKELSASRNLPGFVLTK
jgi:hypothetical protein